MKGLLKGLRYISEIFEADNEKEPEIQIGAPTDVKHVAHIGCDGPSSNAPTWMNEFQGSSDGGTKDVNGGSKGMFVSYNEDLSISYISLLLGLEYSMGTSNRHGKSKQSKKQVGNASVNAPDIDTKTRKNKTSNSDNDSSRARRTKNSGSESPSQDAGAKKNRRKKKSIN
ncbi:hypothetical protein SSX86_023246 [Deinandra increscens subsp. villosa]|uniref:CRIB domain-containing protein n=1 Tax=Deinandra increscens subsp. villosa TaxID=3103831 RepID=A0AAP0CS92_9ASTR